MTRRPAPARTRAAFTIIELLIVVVIIALLAAMLLAGITKVRKYAVATQVTNDISLLETACVKFNQDFGFNPPSTFTIPAVKNSADPNFILFTKMYPRWMSAVADGTATGLPNAGVVLNGNQSMVYFLGGPGNNGWATDAPLDAGAATTKKGPYFDFKPDRLTPGSAFGAPSALPVFLDPYKNPPAAPNGTPYAYFGSVAGGRYPAVACFGVMPFVETASGATVVKYVNQGTVQIISAGEDGAFGPGCPLVGAVQCKYTAGQSAPAAGISPYGEGDVGADDIANFNGGSKLGVGK
jgi:prepilin-type N-terminal cleavage/methylation domain-containing protein